jgi:hypothetical protein
VALLLRVRLQLIYIASAQQVLIGQLRLLLGLVRL